MSVAASPLRRDRVKAADFLALALRVVLGVVFIAMGVSKAMHPVEFLKLVRQYEIFEHHLVLNFVAATVPWFEIFCGLLLVLGVGVRGVAAVLLTMLVLFSSAVLFRGLAIGAKSNVPFCAVKFDCGCGGGEVLVCRKLGENFALIVFSTVLVTSRNRRFCAWPILIK